ncbi:MAG: GDP-mannose 4,6-dehydratase, partial [Dehalococcoidia bacterium]|nr:GDP-mannose 4,6-dehydratase [Dehalococcoidia bacterium]
MFNDYIDILHQSTRRTMHLTASLKDRAIFITGADGFMGSHLVDKLIESGARVHVFIRATSSGELHNIRHRQTAITIHRGDLADKHALHQALSCLKSEDEPLIFHLGAQAHVGESWQRPYETMNSNVLGTLNLLQSVVDLGLKLGKLVSSGTSEEYGNVDPEIMNRYRFEGNALILDERSPLNPRSIYAVSKIVTD